MDTITRNSRWDRESAKRNGRIIRAQTTQRDIEILFPLLARHRYIPFRYLHAFMGGHRKSLSYHLNLLYRKPNYYINRPHQQREHANANYRDLIYELDERGAKLCADHGIAVENMRHYTNFAHKVMECETDLSLELGAKGHGNAWLIPWRSILTSDKFPAHTRELKDPAAIPVGDRLVRPDGNPFVVARGKPCASFPSH